MNISSAIHSNIRENRSTAPGSPVSASTSAALRVHSATSNSVFSPDDLSLSGGNDLPYETYSVSPQPSRESWHITQHFTMSKEDAAELLEEVLKAIRAADFSGMTDVEIYTWIERQYIEAFGENFRLDRASIGHPGRGICYNFSFHDIGDSFYGEIFSQFRLMAAAQATNRVRLFPGMSTSEIQQTIRDRYPKTLTNRELFFMLNEMESVGVDFGVAEFARDIPGMIVLLEVRSTFDPLVDYVKHNERANNFLNGFRSIKDFDRVRELILDQPADYSHLFSGFNLYHSWANSVFIRDHFFGARDLLVDFFGAQICENDRLEPDSLLELFLASQDREEESEFGFNQEIQIPDLVAAFLEKLDAHNNRLYELRKDDYATDAENKNYYEMKMRNYKKSVTM